MIATHIDARVLLLTTNPEEHQVAWFNFARGNHFAMPEHLRSCSRQLLVQPFPKCRGDKPGTIEALG